jgi:hypothetical protein
VPLPAAPTKYGCPTSQFPHRFDDTLLSVAS